SDTIFIFNHRLDHAVVLPDYDFYVAMIHPSNTSPKRMQGANWSRWQGNLYDIMGQDLEFYQSFTRKETTVMSSQIEMPSIQPDIQTDQVHVPTAIYPLRVGYILNNFPPLSETFIRREVLALCRAGHQVFVYTNYRHHDPLVPETDDPRLTVRQIPFLRDASK